VLCVWRVAYLATHTRHRGVVGWVVGCSDTMPEYCTRTHAHTHKHTQHMRNGTHAPTDNVRAVCCPRHPAARICVALCLPAAAISASAVSALRKKTGAGMMDCKKALSECSGDEDKAVEV
jgi:hypothetical protein